MLALVTGELTSRVNTAALPFGLSPWTYDSASPAFEVKGGILRLCQPVDVGVVKPQAMS
jgi:hypothetical protein